MVDLCSTSKGWATRRRRQHGALVAAGCALGLLCALSCAHAQGTTCNLCLTATAQSRTASNAVGKPECDKFAAAISALWPAGNPQFACDPAAVSGTPAAPVLKLCTKAAQADAQAAYSGFAGSSTIANSLSDALYDATTDAGARRSYKLDLTCPTSTNSASKSVSGAAPKQPCQLCLTASATDVKATGPATQDQCNKLAASVTLGWAQKLPVTLPEGFAFSCSSVTGTADAPVLQLCTGAVRSLAQQMVSAYQGNTATDVPLLGDLFGKAVPDGGTMRTFRLEYICPANSGSGYATASRSFDRSVSGCVPGVCNCDTPHACGAVLGQPVRSLLEDGGARRSLASSGPSDMGMIECCTWGVYSGCMVWGNCAKQAAGPACNVCLTATAAGRTGSKAAKATQTQCNALAKSATSWAKTLLPTAPDLACSAFDGTADAALKVCSKGPTSLDTAQSLVGRFNEDAGSADALEGLMKTALGGAIGNSRSYLLAYSCDDGATGTYTKSVSAPSDDEGCKLCVVAAATGRKGAAITPGGCTNLAEAVSAQWAFKMPGVVWPVSKVLTCAKDAVQGTASDPTLNLCVDGLPYSVSNALLDGFAADPSAGVAALGLLLAKTLPDGGTYQTFTVQYTCPSGRRRNVEGSRSFDPYAGCIPGVCDCYTQQACEAVLGKPVRGLLEGGGRRSLASAGPGDMDLVECCSWGYSGCGANGIVCAKQAAGPLCDVCLTSSTTGRTGSKAVEPTQAQCDALAKSATSSWAKQLLPTALQLVCSGFKGEADAQITTCNKSPVSLETAQSLVGKFYEDAKSVDMLEGLMKKALGGAIGNSRSYSLSYMCGDGATATYTKSVGEPPADEGCKLCVLAAASGRKGGAVTPELCSDLATAVSSQWAATMNGVMWPDAAVLACGADAVQGTASEPSLNMCVNTLEYGVANALLDGFAADPSASVASLGALLGKALPDGGTYRTFTAQYTCPSGRWRNMQASSSFDASQPVETCQPSSCGACKTKDECLGTVPFGMTTISPGQTIGGAANILPSRGNPRGMRDSPIFTLVNAATGVTLGPNLSGDPNQPQDGPINFTALGGNGGALLFGNPGQGFTLGSSGTGSLDFTAVSGSNSTLQPLDGSTCCTWDDASGCSANAQMQCPADISGNGLLTATR